MPTGARFSPCLATVQPMRDLSQLSRRKPLYFEIPDYCTGLYVCSSPLQLPPFLSKRAFLSFVLWTCLQFYYSLHVSNYNDFLFLNKLIFGGKITDLFFVRLILPLDLQPVISVSGLGPPEVGLVSGLGCAFSLWIVPVLALCPLDCVLGQEGQGDWKWVRPFPQVGPAVINASR